MAVRQRQHHIDDERLGDVTVTSHTRARGCDVTQRPFRVRQTTITRREYASARGGRAGGLAYTHRQAAERWTTHTHTHTHTQGGGTARRPTEKSISAAAAAAAAAEAAAAAAAGRDSAHDCDASLRRTHSVGTSPRCVTPRRTAHPRPRLATRRLTNNNVYVHIISTSVNVK